MKIFSKKYPVAERIQLAISLAIRFTLVLAIISSIINRMWLVLFVSSLTLFFTFLPSFFAKNYKLCLPLEFELLVMLFIYAALFLGEVHNYYTLFWWWDIVLHTASGIALGFAGFMMMYSLYYEERIKTSPFIIALFSFSFALAIGAVWEIFEFSVDNLLGTNMQKSGLDDTMHDLIVDSIGALLTSFLGYVYIKSGKKGLFFERIVNKFVERNPHLFSKGEVK
ncbi:MAG: hypothetical protein ACQESF_01715 [Nanobdellota archaeon]